MILDVQYSGEQTDPAGDEEKRVAAFGPPLAPQDHVCDATAPAMYHDWPGQA
jgi:hypothetical protein